VLTTITFAPQVIEVSRTGGRPFLDDVSAVRHRLGLWLVYGLLRSSQPLIVANGLTRPADSGDSCHKTTPCVSLGGGNRQFKPSQTALLPYLSCSEKACRRLPRWKI